MYKTIHQTRNQLKVCDINMNNSIDMLKTLILKSNAKLMTVVFVKADGSMRTMYAKTGVKKFLSKNPNKRKVAKKDNNTIRVYDCESKAYRSFKLDSVVELSYRNNIWKV